MKSILFSILLLFIPKLYIAQVFPNDKIIYLDSTWNETNSKNCFYYRIIRDCKSEKESYVIQDYFKSGKLQMEGKTSSKNYPIREGEFIFYYENGNKHLVSNFVANFPLGKKTKWYENGTIQEEGEYFINDEKRKTTTYRVNQFWDSKGTEKVTNGNGEYQEKGKDLFLSGKVKDGVKDGIWEGWINDIETKCTEIYQNGIFVSGTTLDENGITSNYDILEKQPKPKYGMEDFYKYIAQNYKIPSSLPKGTKGKIFISFIVDKEGKIIEPKILRDLGYGTGQEAARILTNYTGFDPAEQRGRKVRCSYSLPISIQSRN